ncbi:hypothetical protein E2C01_038288 [Portunus trituberculatus]|uniref:Uncharacterized protein n=1 Tax=Portunus trituberculatus TaxID=210409 RepID=A0A5B7FBU0_PORTR|nr:hypothetical protein [Portunus trituberculatus]
MVLPSPGSPRPCYGAKNSDRNMKKYNGLQLDEIITEVACFAKHPDWFLPGLIIFWNTGNVSVVVPMQREKWVTNHSQTTQRSHVNRHSLVEVNTPPVTVPDLPYHQYPLLCSGVGSAPQRYNSSSSTSNN